MPVQNYSFYFDIFNMGGLHKVESPEKSIGHFRNQYYAVFAGELNPI